MKEELRTYIIELLTDIASIDIQLILLALLVVVAIIVIDAVTLFAQKQKKEAGIEVTSTTVSIDGSESLPIRNYISDIQGLAGRPDALIMENGYVIPVERKPLARKIRDRYVAQLLVYMRLIEEFEGKKPPYGYLIIGRNCRRFKIVNTEKRQQWLQKMIDEMQAALEESVPIRPQPHPRKCKKCSVRASCSFKIEEEPTDRRSSQKTANSASDNETTTGNNAVERKKRAAS
jgi:CRISPR-associated protein Cas4